MMSDQNQTQPQNGTDHPPRSYVHPELKRLRESRVYNNNFHDFQAQNGFSGFGDKVPASSKPPAAAEKKHSSSSSSSSSSGVSAGLPPSLDGMLPAQAAEQFKQFMANAQQMGMNFEFGAPFISSNNNQQHLQQQQQQNQNTRQNKRDRRNNNNNGNAAAAASDENNMPSSAPQQEIFSSFNEYLEEVDRQSHQQKSDQVSGDNSSDSTKKQKQRQEQDDDDDFPKLPAAPPPRQKSQQQAQRHHQDDDDDDGDDDDDDEPKKEENKDDDDEEAIPAANTAAETTAPDDMITHHMLETFASESKDQNTLKQQQQKKNSERKVSSSFLSADADDDAQQQHHFTDASFIPALAFIRSMDLTADVLRVDLANKQEALTAAKQRDAEREHNAQWLRRNLAAVAGQGLQDKKAVFALEGAVASLEKGALKFLEHEREELSEKEARIAAERGTAPPQTAREDSWCPNLLEMAEALEENFVLPRMSDGIDCPCCSSSSSSPCSESSKVVAANLSKARLAKCSTAHWQKNVPFFDAANSFLSIFAPFLRTAKEYFNTELENGRCGQFDCVLPENMDVIPSTVFLNPALLILQNDVAREVQERQFDQVLGPSQKWKRDSEEAAGVQPWCATEHMMIWMFLRSQTNATLDQIRGTAAAAAAAESASPTSSSSSSTTSTFSPPLIYCPNLACSFRHRLEGPRRLCSVIKMLSFVAERCVVGNNNNNSNSMSNWLLGRFFEARHLLRSEVLSKAVVGVLQQQLLQMDRVLGKRKEEDANKNMQGELQHRNRHGQWNTNSISSSISIDYERDPVAQRPLSAEELCADEELFLRAGCLSEDDAFWEKMQQTSVLCAAAARSAGQLARWIASDVINSGWHELPKMDAAPAASPAAHGAQATLFPSFDRLLANLVNSSSSSGSRNSNGRNSSSTPPDRALILNQLTLCRRALIGVITAGGAVSSSSSFADDDNDDVSAMRPAAQHNIQQLQRKAALLLLLFAVASSRSPREEDRRGEGSNIYFLLSLLGDWNSFGVLPLDPVAHWNIFVVAATIANSSSGGGGGGGDYLHGIPLASCVGAGAIPLQLSRQPSISDSDDAQQRLKQLHGFSRWITELRIRSGAGGKFRRSLVSLLRAVQNSKTQLLGLPHNAATAEHLDLPTARVSTLDANHVAVLWSLAGVSTREMSGKALRNRIINAMKFLHCQQQQQQQQGDDSATAAAAAASGSFPASANNFPSKDIISPFVQPEARYWWNISNKRRGGEILASAIQSHIIGEAILVHTALRWTSVRGRVDGGPNSRWGDDFLPDFYTSLQERIHRELKVFGFSPSTSSSSSGGGNNSRARENRKAVVSGVDFATLDALRFLLQTHSVLTTRFSPIPAYMRKKKSAAQITNLDIAVSHALQWLDLVVMWSRDQSAESSEMLQSKGAGAGEDGGGFFSSELRKSLLRACTMNESFLTLADVEFRAVLAEADSWFGTLQAPGAPNVLQDFKNAVERGFAEQIAAE